MLKHDWLLAGVLRISAAATGTRTCIWPKKVRLQNTGNYEIYNPQALSSALTLLGRHSQGLWVINSIDPCIVIYINYFDFGAKSGQAMA